MGARLHARMAATIRQATLIDRLVTHARPPARRRTTQTLARRGLAATVHGHRHVPHLGCGAGRRPPRDLIRDGEGPLSAWPVPVSEMAGQPAQRADAPDHDPRSGRLARARRREPHIPARAARQRMHRPAGPARADRQRARRDQRPGPCRQRPGRVGHGLAAVRRLGRPRAQAVGDRHRHRDDCRAAAPVHQPARLKRPRAVRRRQLRRRRKGRRRLPQPARTRIPLLAPGTGVAGVLQAPPRRPLGA